MLVTLLMVLFITAVHAAEPDPLNDIVAATAEVAANKAATQAPPEPPKIDPVRLMTWASHVDQVLESVVVGPFKDDLRPAHFAQRNATQIVHVQSNFFRARVLQAMWQSLEEHVEVCPWPPHLSDQAALAVVAQLKALQFDVSWETLPRWRCPGASGYLRVQVPKPTVH